MLTTTQIHTAQAIVNLFETGSVLGDYGNVTVLPHDTGHLTFGRSQTTLGSGNLYGLLQRYCGNPGARFGARLNGWLPRVEARDIALDNAIKLHNLLRATADDKVMRDTQDAFFDDVYWRPAAAAAAAAGISSPLGIAVVYDSTVHGSWGTLRDRTQQQAGPIAALGEPRWIKAYISVRREWLANNPNTSLHPTVYRMDAFDRLVDQGLWGLELPLVVRGAEISLPTLSALPAGCYDAPQPGTRSLALQMPLARGLDVRLLQLGLSDRDVDIKADGVFGTASMKCVKDYQAGLGLPATGVADVGLMARLVG